MRPHLLDERHETAVNDAPSHLLDETDRELNRERRGYDRFAIGGFCRRPDRRMRVADKQSAKAPGSGLIKATPCRGTGPVLHKPCHKRGPLDPHTQDPTATRTR